MASQEEILRSNEAELILKSETFKQSLETLREEYINLWLHTLPEERDLREQLHKSIKLLPEIERHLRIVVEKGKITKANLNRLRRVI
tara:strand:- start:2846 stop:3106 length:261 start_codon:yes stop_codon:yes gene_type:complete